MKLSARVTSSLAWLSNFAPHSPSYPNGTLNMGDAENWLVRPDILPILKDSIQADLQIEDMNYQTNAGGPKTFLSAASTFFTEFFTPHYPIEPSHIVTGTGAMAILDYLVFNICDENEGILIDAPLWSGFRRSTNLRNRDQLVPVDRPDDFSNTEAIIDHYRQAMDNSPVPIRGIIVVNPHNPHGHIYPQSFLEALLKFTEERDIHYISDEIYGLSAWGPSKRPCSNSSDIIYSPETKFTSVLAMDLDTLQVNSSRVHVVYGISKDMGSTGLRLGFFVSQSNPELVSSMIGVDRYGVSAPSFIMAEALFSDMPRLRRTLTKSSKLLKRSAEHVSDVLAFHNIPFYRPAAGVFVWARLGGKAATRETDLSLWEKFADQAVSLAYGASYQEQDMGWFRITFALPQEQLKEGLRRVERALGAEKTFPQGQDLTDLSLMPIVGAWNGTHTC